ncbi:magnesium transporter CorA family protein [Candidatus Electronema sp. JM]|uniref:magnesium transporter CorA family protein n=1 Tax=Candidatus Electronema sp. JM TaxID=3401571 RepID=UPI003AA8D6BD
MIQVFKWVGNRYASVEEIEQSCWVNIVNPSRQEVEKLSAELDIPLDFLTDPLDIDERSRIETEEGLLLIVLRIPDYDENNSEVPFITIPAGIILAKNDILITICSSDINELLELHIGKVKSIPSASKTGFFLRIFLRTALLYLKFLKEINRRTGEIEKELQKSLKNEELIRLLNLEKSLVFFTTALKSNELMMERLLKIKTLGLNEDDEDMLEDVIIENKQAIEMANIYSNILSGMMDAFASVISNNLNAVMKILTLITIIMMIPNLVVSFYGMNIEVPFQHSRYSFLAVLGMSVSMSILGVFFFRKKRWF